VVSFHGTNLVWNYKIHFIHSYVLFSKATFAFPKTIKFALSKLKFCISIIICILSMYHKKVIMLGYNQWEFLEILWQAFDNPCTVAWSHLCLSFFTKIFNPISALFSGVKFHQKKEKKKRIFCFYVP